MSGAVERPVVATIAVVERNGAVLLVQRANPPEKGRWGFPGGKMELGETVAEAAVRELAEETGIRADAAETLTTVDVLSRDDTGTLHAHFVLIAVLCHYVSGEPAAADDALDARWFPFADLADDDPRLSRHVARVARLARDRVANRDGT